METWAIALDCRNDLQTSPTDALRRAIVRAARGHGFFSVWIAVFAGDSTMRRLLIEAFPGTAADCFDAQTGTVTPRPGNRLGGGGKC